MTGHRDPCADDDVRRPSGCSSFAYALGDVGAPTLTAIGVRFTPRQTLVGLMVLFTIRSAASALAPGYGRLVGA